jgi:hypothetical protein
MRRRTASLLLLALAGAGCTGGTGDGGTAAGPASSPGLPSSAAGASPPGSPSASSSPPAASASSAPVPSPSPAPVAFDAAAAYATVQRLARGVGPREATSRAYRRAAAHVTSRFEALGYAVTRPSFRVPAGVSWGVPVPSGRTVNVVARRPGLDRTEPHVVVGAHLDTVPQAPGAEDNASGVAVLLELARLAAAAPPRVPVVLVAFGAEEPRGDGDDAHHYGSRRYVARTTPAERRALVAMVSLDRVGVGTRVPVCTGGTGPVRTRAALRRAAARVHVPVRVCGDDRASDHWSFEKAGLSAARLGSTPYAAYHSARDVPSVVRRAQLRRTGRVVWEAVRSYR